MTPIERVVLYAFCALVIVFGTLAAVLLSEWLSQVWVC